MPSGAEQVICTSDYELWHVNCAGLARSVAPTMLQIPTPTPSHSHSTVLPEKLAKGKGNLGQVDPSDFGVFVKVIQ